MFGGAQIINGNIYVLDEIVCAHASTLQLARSLTAAFQRIPEES